MSFVVDAGAPFDWVIDDSAEEEEVYPSEWGVKQEPFFDLVGVKEQVQERLNIPKLTPSQFVEVGFKMPKHGEAGYENFSFEGRRHMRQPYDTTCKRVLLCTGRQVEKSTLLGNMALSYACLIPAFRALYVSPSQTQTKTFSNDRLKEPIEVSPILKAYTTSALSQNIFEKQFVNWSKITLRYAFLNADRVRGVSGVSALFLDEFQDLLSDNIPVIEQVTSHAPDKYKKFVYAGTPKSLDNNIEHYRATKSTQGEWVVPCDNCGTASGPTKSRYWNILGEKNMGKHSLICERCGKQIYPQCDDAQWAFLAQWDEVKAPYESYRIPQLMVPWKKWTEILYDYQNYPRGQFYNEVLGLSYDSGLRPLTLSQVRDQCNPQVIMDDRHLAPYITLGHDHPIFAGIDWGTGSKSYTVVSLGTYIQNKFRIFYIKRLEGVLSEPEQEIKWIIELLKKFNVSLIGADHGFGHYQNDHLRRSFGERFMTFLHMGKMRRKVLWDPGLRQWKVHRSEVMSDMFNAIKRSQLEFPRWEEFEDPYATDMCNIYSEYNETLRMIRYDHNPDKPDDSFHSILYCFLASMVKFPRPDIIAPRREELNQGPLRSYFSGPTFQG